MAYVRQTAYQNAEGQPHLCRPLQGVYTFSVSQDIEASGPAMVRITRAVDAVTALTTGAVTFSRVGSGGQVTFGIDTTMQYGGETRLTRDGWTNKSGAILFNSLAGIARWDIATHELGHFAGFGHSPETDIMAPGGAAGLDRVPADALFSDHLKKTWRMMAQRTLGQVPPDNDTWYVHSGARREVVVIR